MGGAQHTRRGAAQQFVRMAVALPKPFDECVLWPFGADQNGYAVLKYDGKTIRAHRLVLILTHGAPKPGEQALHSCGNGHLGCINPWHLKWGTAQENAADRAAHGTHVAPKGGHHGCAVLTEEQVLEIRRQRKAGQPGRKLAKSFGVSEATISAIWKRRIWGHI